MQLVLGDYIEQLAKVDSLENLANYLRIVNVPALEEFPADRLWAGIQRRRSDDIGAEDLRREEWVAFISRKSHIDSKAEFQVKSVPVPGEAQAYVASVSQVVRLREVRALRGFTRIDPIPDVGELGEIEAIKAGLAPLAVSRPNWLPGIDQRGEGIFIRIDEDALLRWEQIAKVSDLQSLHAIEQRRWYAARGMREPEARPIRYILLHSLAHLLIQQFGLESGYAASSLRERIYCSTGMDSMAGILIYTASPDSEGSLGGLVEMGRPERLGPTLKRALERSKLCANDPLCADRTVSATGTQLNGAACHACLLESETSCEVGNNYLDRAPPIRHLAF